MQANISSKGFNLSKETADAIKENYLSHITTHTSSARKLDLIITLSHHAGHNVYEINATLHTDIKGHGILHVSVEGEALIDVSHETLQKLMTLINKIKDKTFNKKRI